MISTIGPLVQEAPGQWRRSTTLNVAGSIIGGAAVFGALASVGHLALAGLDPTGRWTVAGVIAFVLALREFGVLRLPLPQYHRSVPQTWWRTLGANRAAFAYGLVLGLGVTTVIPFSTFYAVATWSLLVANSLYGLALGRVYGLGRAVPVLVASHALAIHPGRVRPHAVMAEIAARVDGRTRFVHVMNGLAEAGFAGAALGAVLVSLWW